MQIEILKLEDIIGFFGIKFWNKFPSIPIAVCIVVFAKKKSLNDLLVTKSQAADLYLHVSISTCIM